MKKLAILLVAVLILCPLPVYACTSFAVYFDEPYYGMNFDYENTMIRFYIRERSAGAVFMMSHAGIPFPTTVMMNDRGQFSSIQALYPEEIPEKRLQNDTEANFYQVAELFMDTDLTKVFQWLTEKHLVQRRYSEHLMLAATDNAAILETGSVKNEIMPLEDGYIVMTNFRNSLYRNQPHSEVAGVGADRYRTVCRHIEQNKDCFNLETALAALEMSSQDSTLWSAVFLPRQQTVYFALDRNFDRVWKVSLLDSTLETFRGFPQGYKVTFPIQGITAADLRQGKFGASEKIGGQEAGEADKGWAAYNYVVLGAAGLMLLYLLVLDRGNHLRQP